MSFIEALILSFICGWFNSYIYRKYLRKRNKDWIVFLGVIFIFVLLLINILIYYDIIDITLLNVIPWVNIPLFNSGKYFMWNPFIIFGIDFGIVPQSGMDTFSLFFYASYIFWYYVGSKLGKVVHGYRSYQQGFYFIFRPVKRFIKDRKDRKNT
jgi:hypothetical protein